MDCKLRTEIEIQKFQNVKIILYQKKKKKCLQFELNKLAFQENFDNSLN